MFKIIIIAPDYEAILRVRRRDCAPSVELLRRFRLTCIPALLVQRRLRWFGHSARRPVVDAGSTRPGRMPTHVQVSK